MATEIYRELPVDVLLARRVKRPGLLDGRAVVEGSIDPAVQFPGGVFQGYLDFLPHPGSLMDLRDRRLSDVRRWRDGTPDEDEIAEMKRMAQLLAEEDLEAETELEDSFPYPLWPEPGGVFPWAEGSAGELFFWLRSVPEPASWPVVWCHGDHLEWERFDGTATEFVIALVTGQIEAGQLGSPIFAPPPRFDVAVAGELRPTAGTYCPSKEEIEQIVAKVRCQVIDPGSDQG